MPKMLRPPGSRSPVSVRELILVAALVIAGVSWYREFERSREMNEKLETVNHKFGGILDVENDLRQNPDKKSARLIIREAGGPKPRLQWTMDVEVIDDSPPGSKPPAEAPDKAVEADETK